MVGSVTFWWVTHVRPSCYINLNIMFFLSFSIIHLFSVWYIFQTQIEVCVVLTVIAILDELRTAKLLIAYLYGHLLTILLNFGRNSKQNQNNLYAKITIFFLMLLMTILHVPSFPFLVLLQKYWSQTYAYQTVKSMIPFFYQDLSVLISKIMKIIVKLKSSVWLKCCYQSEKNWFRKAKLFNDKDVNIGFGTSKMLLDLPKKIWLKEHIKFLKDSKHFNISSLKESLLIQL